MRMALLIAGSLLPLVAATSYVVSIFRGHTRPERMTRFLLLAITIVSTISLWAAGDRSGLWLSLVSFVESLVVWIVSLRYGMGGRSRLDIACLILCFLGVLFWLVSDQPTVGLAASIIADLVACIPSLHKTIRLPHTEPTSAYLLCGLAGVCILMAGPLTLEAAAYPVYIAAVNFAFVLAVRWPRKRQLVSEEAGDLTI